MRKDYAKTVYKRPRPPRQWRKIIVPAVLLVLLSVGLGSTFVYNKKHDSVMFNKIVALTHKKSPAEKQKLAANKAAPQEPAPVHFDFYDALPKMQMPPAAETVASVAPAPQLKPVAATPKPVIAKASVFNAEEVTDLLAHEKPQLNVPIGQHYHLQLGSFESESAAKLLVDAVNSIGFQAKVVKSHHAGHNMYHVMQGPYTNMDLAKASQMRLQKRGITSSLKKG
jgi:cell division protein FtsN